MKIGPDHIATMRAAIAPLDTVENRHAYATGNYPRSEHTKDVNRRYRWDLAWAARVDICALYDLGCTDSHVDTALRSIVAPL